MISALTLTLCLAASPDPPPIAGCAEAQHLLNSTPLGGRELARVTTALLLPDLPRLPSVRTALESLDGARAAEAQRDAREALAVTLQAVCALSPAELEAGPAVDPARLRSILARPQFERRAGSEPQLATIAERLWDVIKEVLYSEGFAQYAVFSRQLFLVLVASLTVWLAFKVRRSPPAPTLPHGEVAPRLVLRASVEDLLREADAARARGALTDAVAFEMAAVRRVLAADASDASADARTDREWLAELRGRMPSAPRLDEIDGLVRRFERTFYGSLAVAGADEESFRKQAESILATHRQTSS